MRRRRRLGKRRFVLRICITSRLGQELNGMSIKSAIGLCFLVSGALALVGVGVFAAYQQQQVAALRQQNQALLAAAKDLDRVRSENQEAQRLHNQEAEIQQLREDAK